MAADRRFFGENLSIAAKGLLLVAVPLVAQIGVLMLLRTVQAQVIEAERLAIHSKNVILQSDEIQRLTLAEIAAQRAAVITGDPDYRDNPDAPRSDLRPRLETLASTLADNPPQQRRLFDLRDDLDSLETWLAAQRDLVRQGRSAQAAANVKAREGSDRMSVIQGELSAFLLEEERLDRERSSRLRQVTVRSHRVTLLGAAASLAIACIFAFLFSRTISSRFAVVTDNARRLAGGTELTPPLSGSDEIAQLDVVLRDTARRLAAASAAAANATKELEQRVAELAVLNRELSQRTEENETFIYSVSHDLRSPLVNLQGFSKELTMTCTELGVLFEDPAVPLAVRARAAELLDRDVAESLTFIRSAVTRASSIIDSLLRLSRAGRVEYRPQHVVVSKVVRNVIDAMRATIGERKAEIAVNPLPDAWGDATAIEQVFANLIGNAVNYLDPARPGRVEVGVVKSAPGREIDGPQPVPVATATYYVRDNGLGLPASATAKIFSAFHRFHSRQAVGEGVGLALVRRIVDRHRGRIWLESAEGVGSTFYVELPTEPASAAAAAQDTAVDAPSAPA